MKGIGSDSTVILIALANLKSFIGNAKNEEYA